MSNGEKRPDKNLKAAGPGDKKAKKAAGPKYLRGSLAQAVSISKLNDGKKKS